MIERIKKATHEIRIFDKQTKKVRVISIRTQMDLDALKEYIEKKLEGKK